MTNAEFYRLIGRSGKRTFIIGICILIFGAGMTLLAALGLDKEASSGTTIFVYVFGGICILLGLLMVVKARQSNAQIKNGQHPLAQAIEKGDGRFVLWYFEQIITTQNYKPTAAHQIWIYDQRNKATIISVPSGQVEAVFQFLALRFPGALVGYSEENQRRYKEMVG